MGIRVLRHTSAHFSISTRQIRHEVPFPLRTFSFSNFQIYFEQLGKGFGISPPPPHRCLLPVLPSRAYCTTSPTLVLSPYMGIRMPGVDKPAMGGLRKGASAIGSDKHRKEKNNRFSSYMYWVKQYLDPQLRKYY